MPPRHPVIFVPGFPATELFSAKRNRLVFPPSIDDLVNRKDRVVEDLVGPGSDADVTPRRPIRQVISVSKQAESLYDNLNQWYGYDTGRNNEFFSEIGWDWRKPIDHQAVQTSLASAIEEFAQNNTKPVVIIHSTGGLVLRQLLHDDPSLWQSIRGIVAFGVPWAGTLKAVKFVIRGETFGFLLASLDAGRVRKIMRRSEAAFDLFPPTPDGDLPVLAKNESGRRVSPLDDRRWVPATDEGSVVTASCQRVLQRGTPDKEWADGNSPFVLNVVGWGRETETLCRLDGSTAHFETSKEGDGTVALSSASWIEGGNVRTQFLPIGAYPTSGIPMPHSRLWDSPPVHQLLDEALWDDDIEPFVCAAADGDEAVQRKGPVTIRLTAADVDGSPLPDASFIMTGINEKPKKLRGVRTDITLDRDALAPNAAGRHRRFDILVSWEGGEKAVPMLVKV